VSSGATSTATIPLADRLIAGIIGKGGSIIRDISSRSGATVRVSQKQTMNDRGERDVIMEGGPQQVAMAQQLVHERVREIESGADPHAPPNRRAEPPRGQPSYAQAQLPAPVHYAQQYQPPQPSAYSTYYSQPPPAAPEPSYTQAPPGFQINKPLGGGY